MSVVALVRLTAKPRQRKDLLKYMAGSVAATRKQPLCNSISVMESIENSDDVFLIEQWLTVEAHQNFISSVVEIPSNNGTISTRPPLLSTMSLPTTPSGV